MIPSKNALSKLLTIEGTQESYRIPKYQRPYSWGGDEWQQLLDDINDDASDSDGHYMGSVICVDESSGEPGAPRVYELIDGQQRMTTLSCLLVAVWKKLNDICTAAAEGAEGVSDLDEDDLQDLRTTMDSVRRKVVREHRYSRDESLPRPPSGDSIVDDFFVGRQRRTDFYCRLLPSTQDLNRDDYVYALVDSGLLPLQELSMPRNWGNRRLARCVRYFAERLPGDILALTELVRRVNALVFIHIKVDSQSDAFRLFEAINNRGVPLSALDIIKNALLAALERKNKGSIDEAFETWSAMMKRLGSDASVHESYLRHFYNAFQVEPSCRVERTTRATKSTLIRIYEQLIKGDAEGLLRKLVERARHYSVITQPDQAEPSDLEGARRARLINLARIEAKPSHQFLLYLLDRESQGKSVAEEVDRIIDLLARYFVRRNLTNVPATNRLDAIFIDLVTQCEKALEPEGATLTYDMVREALLGAPRGDSPASDEQLQAALEDHLYEQNAGMARYLLCHYVESRVTREQAQDLWRRDDKGRYVWTIEHVLPQASPLRPGWIEMLGQGNADTARAIQEDTVHRLGNLTLSAYNSSLSNAEFPAKQEKTTITLAGQPASIGFQNGLLLNALTYELDGEWPSLATTKVWNQRHIAARGEVLIQAMMQDYCL